MGKYSLSAEHLEKRRQKKHFVLRDDIMGSFLQRELSPRDYFDMSFSFPKEVDKIMIDCMPDGGDWHSVYESELVPMYRAPYFARFHRAGIDLYGEWLRHVHGLGKECWLTHRVGDVLRCNAMNPIPALGEHPEWFLDMPQGYKVNNLSVPEIQERKLKIFGEVMRKYPFDGLDIDFERHTPILPPGEQWEMREYVTEFMRKVRRELLKISEEQGRVIMLSARVPDCLKGCHTDGLDIGTWVREELVDCLTLGSRSFDIKVEEFRALSEDIQLYGCYDPHHTVDGYTFPTLETLRGVWYSHLQRGADGVEYFNWSGEGQPELIDRYVKLYGLDPDRDNFVRFAKDDFTGADDREFLAKQDKTYVIDRKGGYPWGVGYGNMNADRQLPCVIGGEGEVVLYVAENIAHARKAVLKLLFEELDEIPEITFNGKKLTFTAEPHRDLQVTAEPEAPVSGFKISQRLCRGVDLSKPCTRLTADLTGTETEAGYQKIRVVTREKVRLEKAELELLRKKGE